MKRHLLVVALCLSGLAHAESAPKDQHKDPFVSGDAATGASKAAVCGACHGPTGNSSNPEWPKLAGQHSSYVFTQLKAFKTGERRNPVMLGQTATLSEQDMRDLAAHFATLSLQPGVASPASVKVGEKLYRAGDASRGLPACAACHGPQGLGNAAAGYPRIGGQHSAYNSVQLKVFKAGERIKGTNSQMMTAVAAKLTDPEIEALASYLNGLQ